MQSVVEEKKEELNQENAESEILSTSPIMLFDTSYLSFYRYFATMNWYKLAHQEEIISDSYKWFENQIFMDKFSKMYSNTVTKMQKKFKIPNQNCIFAKDCSRKDIWRLSLFPEYKAQREATYAQDTWQGGPVLKYAHQELVPKICAEKNYHMIIELAAEADDVIACIKKDIRDKYPKQEIIIITNDCDFLQLVDNYTKIVNLKMKVLNEKSCGCPKKDLEIKILMGDASDNIPRCFKRCGIKTATKYANNIASLEAAFQKEIGSREKYELNRQLIDMEQIPEQIRSKVLQSWEPRRVMLSN